MSELKDKLKELADRLENSATCHAEFGLRREADDVADELLKLAQGLEEGSALTEDLKVGDRVESLIDYLDVRRGMKGTVERLLDDEPSSEFDYKVKLDDGDTFISVTNWLLFKRNELRKLT